ncbi:DsbA family protein [Martelella endophytica]|uniref:Thioredoxin domain-containing protein n=1 Tax=Martelella endophytica TaxID=1486262 RepID=A0A0D5LKY1_MAREN|nr:thioredoxin domain-containing protein [Martelella endophytica]AJY44826.1 hypothetical protein TM49_02590 [Martelella endophytica]
MHNRRSFMTAMVAVAAMPLFPLPTFARTVGRIAEDPAAPVLGNPNGDVTIVEFFDFQCGYCRSGYRALREAVAEDGQVRLVLKDWTVFGSSSVYAAEAALAARRLGVYENALSALMSTRGRLTPRGIDRVLARKGGLNMDAIHAEMATGKASATALLARNDAEARSLRLEGTPSFVIGRQLIAGDIGKRGFAAAIANARASA